MILKQLVKCQTAERSLKLARRTAASPRPRSPAPSPDRTCTSKRLQGPAPSCLLAHSQPRAVHCGAVAVEVRAMAKEAPVGEWVSPITSEAIVSQSIRLGSPAVSLDGSVYWTEGRPTEGGRQVLVCRAPDGSVKDVTPVPDSGFNVRTTCHEYGGGQLVVGEGAIYFSNFKDQRLYKQTISGGTAGAPEPLTAADTGHRYADGIVDTHRPRIISVREDHSAPGEAVSSISAVDLGTGASKLLVGGRDFYASPRLSPDGAELAWVCWDHPNMPWDDTELWVGTVAEDGSISDQRKVAGGKDESVMQPMWTAGGELYFISDRSGWWNIYRHIDGAQAKAVCPKAAEFGAPAWMFGQQSYTALPGGKFLVVYSDPQEAGENLAVLDPASGALTSLKTDYYSFGNIAVCQVGGKLVVSTTGASPLKPSEVALLEVASVDELIASTPEQWQTLRRSSTEDVDSGYLSAPVSIEFPTENGLTAFMNYYAPVNKDFSLLPGDKPPLLVKIHGGPTSQASTAFNLGVQYWTSRGYAIADVNYGGSTGYGREFRNRLRGTWGVTDVDDCCNAAKHLAEKGEVDSKRLCITGGSAGGYTTLACLAFRDVFSAGASHYGVADLMLLAQETHKFESRYLDSLLGKLPEAEAIYKERSPIHALDKFTDPIAFFQGDEDQVVPPNQAKIMFDAIKARGVPTSLTMFKGEQHGFRQATNIRRALDGEWFFYGTTLGFKAEMPEDLEPIEVVNV